MSLFQTIGITLRPTDSKVELKLARRRVIQPVPVEWTPVSTLDNAQLPYAAEPFINTQLPPTPGLHPDILLWVKFKDGDYSDLSSYHRTPTLTIEDSAATLINDYLYIDKDYGAGPTTSFLCQVTYPIEPLPYDTNFPKEVPVTVEGFVKWVVTPQNSFPFHIFRYMWHEESVQNMEEFGAYSNGGDVQYNNSGFGTEAGPTTNHPLAPTGTLRHWAWVIPASNGADATLERFYVDGVEVFNWSRVRGDFAFGATNYFCVGGQVAVNGFAPNRHTTAYIGETRVVARNLYPNGTTFTPPTPGNLPPIT